MLGFSKLELFKTKKGMFETRQDVEYKEPMKII